MPAVHLIKNGDFVVTPVLTAEEARFVVGGISRSEFDERAKAGGLPWYGTARMKRYDEAEVLAWWKGGWRFPAPEPAEAGGRAAGKPRLRRTPGGAGLIDPKSGREYTQDG